MAKPVERYLEKIYADPSNPGSYGSLDKLYRQVKLDNKHQLTKAQVRDWLSSQSYYTLNKQVKRNLKKRRVISPFIGYLWDADTANMARYAKHNENYKHILGVICTFSKKLHTRPLKTLKTKEVAEALKDILKEIPRIVNFRTDGGSEFGLHVKKLLRDRNINHIVTSNSEKANMIERVWLTLKRMIVAWMAKNNSHRWKDQLQNFTSNYNNSYHRTSSNRQIQSRIRTRF